MTSIDWGKRKYYTLKGKRYKIKHLTTGNIPRDTPEVTVFEFKGKLWIWNPKGKPKIKKHT